MEHLVVGVSGSPRKSATYYSLELVLQEAERAGEGEIVTEMINLHDSKVTPCNHCNYCKRNKSLCIIEDSMTEIYPTLREAAAFVFASPVYAMNITPQLAAFFTRMRPLHEVGGGILRNKIATGVAVGGTRNGGQEHTINAIINACLTRGIVYVGNEPGNYSGAMVWSKDNGRKGVDEDTLGRESLINLGGRIAGMTRIVAAGSFTLAAEKV